MAYRSREPKVVERAVDLGGRVMPHDEAAEDAVLAAVLTHGAPILDEIGDEVSAGDFYVAAKGTIYAAAVALQSAGQPVDITTVAHHLRASEHLQAIGGIAYLAQVVDATPAVANVAAHARIVAEMARLRQAITLLQLKSAEGYGDVRDVGEWIESVEAEVYALARKRAKVTAVDGYDMARDAMVRLNALLERGGALTGTSTGLRDVDEKTGGMRPGELIIVAARPGMGKTSHVVGQAWEIAAAPMMQDAAGNIVKPRQGVMFFSLEMPKEQISDRLVCYEARLDIARYRKGVFYPGEYDRAIGAMQSLAQLPIWVDDTPAITVQHIRAAVRRKQSEFNRCDEHGRVVCEVGLVILDYLQLARAVNARSREEEISEISRGLKGLSKELRVPVVALSQLNRSVEKRSDKDKRPQLSDLRESGAIEQDADVIEFLYRPEYYIADKDSDEAKRLKGYAEVIIAKQRNGPTGRVPVTFVDHCARFENRARDAWREEGE